MSCLTLSMLAANTSSFLNSNMTLIFLAGNHTLNTELSMSNIDDFLRLSANDSATTSITCGGNANLTFGNITQMQINGLEFVRCSGKVEFVDHFF